MFQEETTSAHPFGEMFAAEVRHRAAGDDAYLLPPARNVKGPGVGNRQSVIGKRLSLSRLITDF